MNEKQELIAKMLELQKKFAEYEHEFGVSATEYFAPPPGHPLEDYSDEFNRLANRLRELAHEEQGSRG